MKVNKEEIIRKSNKLYSESSRLRKEYENSGLRNQRGLESDIIVKEKKKLYKKKLKEARDFYMKNINILE